MAILSPAWNLSCEVCESFIWKEDGSVQRKPDGEPMQRISQEIPTRCPRCPKVPRHIRDKGDWKDCRKAAVEITPENALALLRYKEFRATGNFPDDPIVGWYSAVIREIEDERQAAAAREQTELLATLTTVLTVRKRR